MIAATRIAVVDDDPASRATLTEHLRRFQEEEGLALAVSQHSEPREFVDRYESDVDIILLDVQMPELDGFETAARIRALDADVVIIFITNMAQDAIRGYQVDALSYLVKPVSYFALAQELRRGVQRVRRSSSHSLLLTTGSGMARVEVPSILYISSVRHRITVHALDRKHTLTGTLKSFEQDLAAHDFHRCNNSFLVNLHHVVGVEGTECVLRDGERLPISRPRRMEFLRRLTDHIGGP